MTNEEAIKILGYYDVSDIHFYDTDGEEIPFTDWSDAIEMAISALQTQELNNSNQEVKKSSDKLIKASDAVDIVAKHSALYGNGEISTDDGEALLYDIMSEIMNLPSAQPERCEDCENFGKTRLLIPQPEKRTEECTETHACDLISRQAAIDVLDVLCQEHRYRIPGKKETYSPYNEAWQDALDRAENAIGNLPPAQPERKTGRWIDDNCSECGQYVFHGDVRNFCPSCGAKMIRTGERNV